MLLLLANLVDDAPALVAQPDEDQVQRLVAAAREGDALAARRLYRFFATRVYRAVRPLLASDADAEDVVQDSFIKAFGQLHRYQPRPGKRFAAWLMTVALNTARKQARRGGRWLPVAPERASALRDAADAAAGTGGSAALGQAGLPPSPETALQRGELRRDLLAALEQLDERDRQVILLRYGAELTAAEVGEVLDLKTATVRKICQRRRLELMDKLAPLRRDPAPAAVAEETP